MVISQTPLRLSFAGGGSDLPDFFLKEEGAVLSTTLRKYITVSVNRNVESKIRLCYEGWKLDDFFNPETNACEFGSIEEIAHPITRCVLKRYLKAEGGLERGITVASSSEVPPGSGLGSSSSFTVGLLHAFRKFLGQTPSCTDLAKEACCIEIDELKEPIGKQDQFIAAFGGLKFIRFRPSGQVIVENVKCDERRKAQLEKHVLLFFTGTTRKAQDVLAAQKKQTQSKRAEIRQMVEIAKKQRDILENGLSFEKFGRLLDEAWRIKKGLAANISTPEIDLWYERGLKAGAWGGKILGAGRGGFLMLFCDPQIQERVRAELSELEYVPCEFESEGTRLRGFENALRRRNDQEQQFRVF